MKWYNSIEIVEHLCVWSHVSHHLGMDNSKAAFHGIQRSSKSPYFWMYSFNTSVFTTFLKGPCRADQLHVFSRFLWWICKLQAFLTIASSDVNRRIRHFSTRLERFFQSWKLCELHELERSQLSKESSDSVLRSYGLHAYLIHRNGAIGFTVLQCIIFIEFVKNIRNIKKSIGLLWFYFVCFEIWKKKPSKAGRHRAPSSGHCVVHVWKIRRDPIGAAFPTKSCAMSAMCAIRMSRASPHRAQATSFLWVVIFLCPKFRLDFWWFIGSSVSQDISSLYKTIAE